MIFGLTLLLGACMGAILLDAAASPDPAFTLQVWGCALRLMGFGLQKDLALAGWKLTHWPWFLRREIAYVEKGLEEPILAMFHPEACRALEERLEELRTMLPPAEHPRIVHKLTTTDEKGRSVAAFVGRCGLEDCEDCATGVQIVIGKYSEIEGGRISVEEGYLIEGAWSDVRLAPIVLAYATESNEARRLFAAIDRAEGFADQHGEAHSWGESP